MLCAYLLLFFKMCFFRFRTLILSILLFTPLHYVYSDVECVTIGDVQICIDRCEHITCENGGNCSSGVCSCADGFTDKLCSTDIDECEGSPCQNGGTCVDGTNSFNCTCASGYEGTTCETNINECSSSPCSNGWCIDGVNSFRCICKTGYTGTTCESDITCDDSPCQNGGNCSTTTDGYSCTCPSPYLGTHCTTAYFCGSNSDCQNGGECGETSTGTSCTCVTGYSGTYCETNIDDCTDDACLNGGECNDGINSYNCTCAPGFYGETCNQSCSNTTYGQDCAFNCTCDVENTDSCDPVTGDCTCIDGWTDDNCTSVVETDDTTVETASIGLIVGLVIAAVALILLIAISVRYVVIKKRNKPKAMPTIEYVDSKAGKTNGISTKNGNLSKEQTYVNNESGSGINTTTILGSTSSSRKMPLPEVPSYVNTTMKLEAEIPNPAYEGQTPEMTYENTEDNPDNEYDFIPADDHLIDTSAYTDLVDPATYYI